MHNGGVYNGMPPKSPNHAEFSFSTIFKILNRGKFILLFSVLAGVLLAWGFNFISKPVYETSTVIKKEGGNSNNYQDEFQKITQMQSPDEIETEIEILKSRTVVEKAVDELDLFFKVNKISIPGIEPYEFGVYLAEYQDRLAENPEPHLPRLSIVDLQIPPNFKGQDFYITVLEENTLALYEKRSGSTASEPHPTRTATSSAKSFRASRSVVSRRRDRRAPSWRAFRTVTAVASSTTSEAATEPGHDSLATRTASFRHGWGPTAHCS